MNDTASPTLASRLRIRVAEALEATTRDAVETTSVPSDKWLDAARALKDEGFIRFIDLTVVDYPEEELRFEIHLVTYSMTEQRWARLKTRTDGKLTSVHSLFSAVHNYEREAFDLYGVTFEGHPKLNRILLPDAWDGHPLRRDVAPVVEPVDFTITRDLYKT